eukprot:TRINITY_DN15211_c0_g1_i2.p1 TRINITY_DN15211_c0_g1~~TRINITY_DN15211_c0_g1_i2.p1  ORF type:complete len:177 (+),score=18.53 TRINITY_DN15211_c0_g1_i2:66-596(+)
MCIRDSLNTLYTVSSLANYSHMRSRQQLMRVKTASKKAIPSILRPFEASHLRNASRSPLIIQTIEGQSYRNKSVHKPSENHSHRVMQLNAKPRPRSRLTKHNFKMPKRSSHLKEGSENLVMNKAVKGAYRSILKGDGCRVKELEHICHPIMEGSIVVKRKRKDLTSSKHNNCIAFC